MLSRGASRPLVRPPPSSGLRTLSTALIDTGPLVAYLNRKDRYHAWAVERLADTSPPLLTCEAVLSEAAFLTAPFGGGAELLSLVQRGLLQPSFRLQDEAQAVEALLRRYASVPMDLADACLVRMADQHAGHVLLTIDSEFRDIYRRRDRKIIPCDLPPGVRRRRRKPSRSS